MKRIAFLFLLCALSLTSSAQTKLNGAGATFPYPIYSKWFSEYNKLHHDVEINYQSIGSGGGIKQVTEGTVDFGATDGPMSNEQLGAAKSKITHIPTVLGAVVPAYFIPGYNGNINFSGATLANIFLGRITSWNDAAIAKDNPGAKLPNVPIVVVHRSDGSGTTYCFTDYLSKVSGEWNSGPGKGTSVKWPAGIGAKGNEGVAGMIRQMEGAIGYIELIYAEQNHIDYGSVKNVAGDFVKASVSSVTTAAASAKIPADYRVSITNAPGKGAYPISTFTWLLIPAKNADANKQKAIMDFLNWMVNEGQKMTEALSYAPLPKEVATRVLETIKQIK
jgi:phosphate transport system substrate-binding protein